ncbi:hypothetical protein M8J77_003363 [Diaphorina citri]|nr:hypothetical protein M8J77_003363 [Diaphorina citri]
MESINLTLTSLNLTHDVLTKEHELLLFLDRSGNLADFRHVYILHREEKHTFYLNNGYYPPFNFAVQIDPEILFELSGDLGVLFVTEVEHFRSVLIQTLNNYLRFLTLEDNVENEDEHCDYKEDLEVWIELLSDYFPDPNFSFQRQHKNSISLQKLTGSLIYLTAPKKYEKSRLFKCESRACHYQRRVKHGRKPPSCILTGHPMIEVPRATEVGEYMDARFLFEINRLPLTVRIPLKISKLQWTLGCRYNVVFQFDVHLSMYSAWYVSEAVPDLKPFLSSLPESIQNLRAELENQCAQSPWTLVNYMSAELCSNVTPRGVFHNLKMGLLLSLASMRCNAGKPVPLLCLGPENTTLIREASILSHHLIDMTANPSNQQGCVEGIFSDELQAGPLQIARDGICYVGEWSKYGHGKHSPASKILKALEDGYISTTNQGKTHLCQLKCLVWATLYWVPNNKASSNQQSSSLKVILE